MGTNSRVIVVATPDWTLRVTVRRGGSYTMCVRNTSGTGGDRCGGAASWNQYYSIRHDNRTCGTISVTEHFKAWEAAGNKLGNLLEVKVLMEVGGGMGTAAFSVANVSKTM